MQAHIEKHSRNLDHFKNLAFEVEKAQSRGKEPGVIFPYFQYIMADAFNLIQDYEAAYKMIQPKSDADWYKKSYVASKDAMKNIQIGCIGIKPRKTGMPWPIFSMIIAKQPNIQ